MAGLNDKEIGYVIKALTRYAYPPTPNGVPQKILLDAVSIIAQLLEERDEARAKAVEIVIE